MKQTPRITPILTAVMMIIFGTGASMPQAMAESSLLIQLNEQLNQETNEVKDGLAQLKTSSSHQKSAHDWAEKVSALPTGSKDHAYARAQYAHAVAADLEQKFQTVTRIQHAASAMTETIDRLIDAHARSNTQTSLFSSKDSVEVIQAKARQLKGLNNMFVRLISTDPSMQSPKVRQAYRVYQLQVQNAKLQASIPSRKGIDSLLQLKDSSESISFLARAYLNGLQHQANITQIVSIGGEASLVNRQAEEVMADAFDVLNPNGQAMVDMQMMLDSIDEPSTDVAYHMDGNPGLSDDIDAIAAKFIGQKQ